VTTNPQSYHLPNCIRSKMQQTYEMEFGSGPVWDRISV